MTSARRVGLVLGSQGEVNRAIARGVAAYARVGVEWVFNAVDLDLAQIPELRRWRPAGVIAMLVDPALARAVLEIGAPVVSTAKVESHPELPRVDHDDVEIGRLVGRHLLERGLRHFGFIGLPARRYSSDRQAGFAQALSDHGFTVESHLLVGADQLAHASGWPSDTAGLRLWLKALPKPAGVLVCSDWHGWKVAEVCRDAGVRVPEDIALVGVDNDEPWCSLSHPPLTSVITSAERIGYAAAARLDRLMTDPTRREPPLELPPVGIITRRSSDTIAVDDPEVAQAARFIRERAHRCIDVEQVVAGAGVGRRSLERRFRSAFGRSIGQDILQVRVQKAKDLLGRTDLAMPQIAKLSGFTNAKRFSETFSRLAGVSPIAYRQQHQPRR